MDTNRSTSIRISHAQISRLSGGLALAFFLAVGLPTFAQAPPVPPVQAPSQGNNNDITRGELASFDQFLDEHPEISEQLRKDPSLIDNKQFVDNRPELQQYLQAHPGVREEIRQNPNAFMHAEERYDRREDRGDHHITRGELASFDQFMDGHPEISEQLRKDPSLIDNKQFVDNHPALQQYLQSHPGVREEFRENPNAFMHAEERYDRQEDRGDRDYTRGQLASMDRFLDQHPEISEQLQKDPSLVDNKQFVNNHPALQQYLQEHPEIREEFRNNPNAFMRAEDRYDQRADAGQYPGRDMGRDASFGDFLRMHNGVAQQLSKDPSLANNQEYLESHPELRDYLNQHPGVQQQLAQNPQAVMTSAGTTTTMPKTTTPPVKPEPKQ